MAKRKIDPMALAREDYIERAKDAGLKQITVRLWVWPEDADSAREAMRDAGEPWRQDTNFMREVNQ